MNLRQDPTPKQELALFSEDNDVALKSLVDVYPEEAIQTLIKNKDKLYKIAAVFDNACTAVSKAAMIMKCNSETCPFKTSCILNKNGITPDGYPCPLERKIAMELEYSIINELEIDSQSTIEMELLYDFIDAKLLDMRTSGMIADGSLVQIIEMRSEHGVTTTKDISPEFKIKMDLKKLKFSIMEEFMATRKAKKRYGIANNSSFEAIIKNAMNGKVDD